MTALAGARFPILSDPDGATARSYGVFDLLGDGVATPATFIVKQEGSIGWRYVGQHIGDRATIQDILNAWTIRSEVEATIWQGVGFRR